MIYDCEGSLVKKNRIFLINIEMDEPKYLNICVKDKTGLWHMRLRHVNFDRSKMTT